MLDAQWPLDGVDIRIDGIVILGVTRLSVVSISIPRDGESKVSAVVKQHFGEDLPHIGSSLSDDDQSMRLLRLGRDELLLLTDAFTAEPVLAAQKIFGKTAYLVDLSDSYAMLEITGGRCLEVLERLCPLDLHSDRFETGAVARTVMEHLDVIIQRGGEDKYLLMSARSSAKNFLHAVQTSAENVS